MFTKQILPVLGAVGYAAAQAGVCTTTATVNSPAEATSLGSNCQTVKGNVVIGSKASGIVDLGGLQQITGDLTAENNGDMITLQGSNLGSIGGDFKLNNVTGVSSLSFDQLSSVGSIAWTSVPSLTTISFTKKITKAKSVVISDSYLDNLDGLDIESLATMEINNNRRLAIFNTKLSNLSDHLIINANGQNLSVSFPNLIWIANMTILNVASFSAPSLATVNGSARFDGNYFSSFNAPNLTSTKSGDISFVDNSALTNITFPVLTSIGGGLLIANNTNLGEITGFPKVKTVGGAIKLRGNFTQISFPALNDVKGAFDASSTKDISASCTTLQSLSGKGSGHPIQGTFACTSHNETANSDTSTGTSGTTGGSSGNNTAAGVQINHALLGLAVIGGFAQLW